MKKTLLYAKQNSQNMQQQKDQRL